MFNKKYFSKLNIILQIIIKILFTISLFFVISSTGLPIILDLIIFTIIIFIFRKSFKSIMFINFLLISTLITSNIFLMRNYKDVENYYRAHERFITDKFIYKKNVFYKGEKKHGDIIALDYCNQTKNLIESENQIFITDELGFRNDKTKISNADIIFVGDSLITGTSNSQENIPANILKKLSNLNVYTLSVIGGPQHYEHYLEEVIDLLKDDAKVILFYSEGSDFEEKYVYDDPKFKIWNGVKIPNLKYKVRFGYERLERNKDKIFIKKFNNLYNYNYFYKKIRPKSQRIVKKILAHWTNTCPIEILSVNNIEFGVYYKPMVYEASIEAYIFKNNKKILNKILGVVYLPTKYSVYGNLTDKNFKTNTQKFEYLTSSYAKYNILTYDLTKDLIDAAKQNLINNKLIFLKDDTHWNKIGISAAMNSLLKILKN